MPLDVVKSRIQADNPANPKYKGMLNCIMDTYRKHGLGIFGRGYVAVSLRAFPTNAFIFVAYAWALDLCRQLTATTVKTA